MSETGKRSGLLSGDPASLRKSFPVPDLEEWQREVVRLLKGAPFEKRMKTATYEGFSLNPIYTSADIADLKHIDALPGEAPFHRGSDPLGYRGKPWEVAQELPYAEAGRFNQFLRRSLERGQSVVNLVFDRAGQAGLDPDEAPGAMVGWLGTSIATLRDLETALSGVDLAKTPVYLQPGVALLPAAALLQASAKSSGVTAGSLQGAVLTDPLGLLASQGVLPGGLPRFYDSAAVVTKWALQEAPGIKTLFAAGYAYNDGGSNAVRELAFTISSAVATLREMEKRGIDIEDAAKRTVFGFSVGTNFFMEIAKLRAARLLWAQVIKSCGCDDRAGKMTIFARGSSFTKTAFDPYVNILRSTTEALSAVFGGCDLLHVNPFDEPLGEPGDLSRRLARNTQLILREECHLDYLVDPVGGSWFIESLTATLARKAWAEFQSIEGNGGLAESLFEGTVQKRIAETALARRENISTRRDIIVGTNQYPDAEELDIKMTPRDEKAQQLAEAVRSDRDGAVNRETLLVKLTGMELAEDIVDAASEAVAGGVSLGDLMKVFASETDTDTVRAIGVHRGAEAFEELRLRVLLWRKCAGGIPQVFLANMGEMGRYMPRLDFARSFYQLAGLEVKSDESFETPLPAAKQAEASGAPVVVIVGTDQTYIEVVTGLAKLLREIPHQPWIVLAGYPKDKIETYRAAGVNEFIHLRSDAYTSLQELVTRIGVES